MKVRWVAVLALFATTEARAQFWERPARLDPLVGFSVLVRLGAVEDGWRVGAQLDGSFERVWLDRPYWGGGGVRPTPIVRAGAHVGWTHPRWFSELTAQVGLGAASGADTGYTHLAGAMAGGGLGLATDGFAGPVLAARLVGPFSTASLEVDRWQGAWHAPRFAIGPELNTNCCGYYL